MPGFTARWLGDSLRLGLGLATAVAAMQVPAVMQAYDSALYQVAEEGRRDIVQREQLARQYYRLPEGDEPALIEALRTREPSNAGGLEASIAREGALREAHARIEAAPALLRPVVALWDARDDSYGNKRTILWRAVDQHVPQILLGPAAATWGLVGLVLGLLVANLLLSLLGLLFARRRTA